MKKVGRFMDVPVYEDPDCPPGMVYMINEKNMYSSSGIVDGRSRWQKFRDWFANKVYNLLRRR